MKWTDRPTRSPHLCAITKRGKDEPGPFLDLELDVFESYRDDADRLKVVPRLSHLYICARAVREACEKPGSPFAAILREDFEEYEAGFTRLEEECADKAARIEELEAELAERPQPRVMDQEDLAEFMATLDQRYAKKTGPKAKA